MKFVLRLIPAVILLQTLFFKFTGAAESIYIFSTLGVEPWGRYLAGSSELVAAILLLIPRTTFYGSVLTITIMLGAFAAHFLFLGIVVQNDGGLLFMLACITFLCATLNIYCLKK